MLYLFLLTPMFSIEPQKVPARGLFCCGGMPAIRPNGNTACPERMLPGAGSIMQKGVLCLLTNTRMGYMIGLVNTR